MREDIDFQAINVIPCRHIQIVEGIHTCVNQTTQEPYQILLKVATDKTKHPYGALTIPVYIPVSVRHSTDHNKLLERFKSGEPFVAVICHNFKLYRKRTGMTDEWTYYGSADSFTVVDYYLIDGGDIE